MMLRSMVLGLCLVLAAMPARALLVVEAESGRLLGSATPIGGDRVLTNRHVVDPALRRGATIALLAPDGTVPARVQGTSERMDLAVLVAARPVAREVAVRTTRPAAGERVAAARPQAGAMAGMAGGVMGAMVGGSIVAFAWPESWGPALFARLPVVHGSSGGALRDAEGRVLGLVTAAVNPDARQVQMLRTRAAPYAGGTDPAAAPLVLVLPIGPALAEARRLDPGCCARAPAPAR